MLVVATAQPLVPAARLGLDTLPGSGGAMKQQRERESAPIWVWLAFGLMIVGGVAYLTGYWAFEEMVAHMKK